MRLPSGSAQYDSGALADVHEMHYALGRGRAPGTVRVRRWRACQPRTIHHQRDLSSMRRMSASIPQMWPAPSAETAKNAKICTS